MSATQTIARPASAAPVVKFTGKAKLNREVAFATIAPLAYSEGVSRSEVIRNINIVFGSAPGEALIAATQAEWIVGRVTSRVDASVFPPETTDASDRLDYTRSQFFDFAAPADPKARKAPKLPRGKKGRRSTTMHKAIRAAEQAWSMVLAETGFGSAQTQKATDAAKKKRAAHRNESKAAEFGKDAGAAPTHGELVKPEKAPDADHACNHVESMASTLLAFANKNAKLLPTDYGSAVQAFKTAINKAANDRALAKAAADANAK